MTILGFAGITASSIAQYVSKGFIGIGNALSQLADPSSAPEFVEPKRNWMLSYFGEWPIRWVHGGLDVNIDPFFIVILSSTSAVVSIGLLWLIYKWYFKKVWIPQKNPCDRKPEPFQGNQDGRNDVTPPGIDELSPNSTQGSTGASNIVQEIKRLSKGLRLTRKPAAVNIRPNCDNHVRPVPRTPLQPLTELQNLGVETPCQIDCGEDDIQSLENSDEDEEQISHQSPPSEQGKPDEIDEFQSIVECAQDNFYEIAEEDSDDSSSQTEYDRYNDRSDEVASAASPGHGDHNKVFEESKEKESTSQKQLNFVGSLREIPLPASDRVVLHQFPRGRTGSVPCLAPFAMKLETYLRMAEIDYDIAFDCDCTGPWLSYHNENFKGASSCFQFLKQVFPSHTENFLPSPDTKIVSWFITILVEYHLYWELIIWRWLFNEGRDVLHNQPNWNLIFPDPKVIGDCVKLGAQYHGFGHLSDSITDVKRAVMKDLEALSESLGDKDFLTGTAPREVDCSAFAILSQLLWSSSDPILNAFVKLFPANIVRYCDRMKSILWADWHDILSKPEEFSTDVATYHSSAETSPLVSPRSDCSSGGPFGSLKRTPKSFNFRLPQAICTETTEVFVRKTVFTENQFWNLSNFNVSNLPNSLNLCSEEYFDENLEDMESIKMKNLESDDYDETDGN